MEREKITIGVVGLGLLGGSASLKLRESGLARELVGYDINSTHIEDALTLGIIDVANDLEELCRVADLVILAIPVNAALKVLPIIMNTISASTVVVDFGSTKQKICEVADSLPNRSQYVACHPIAGTENTGPSAAFSKLLENKVNIICDREGSSERAIDVVIRMTEALGMRIKFMDSKSHDRHIAYVSHLSHISSFTLGQTVLEVEKDEDNIFDMAGSGFASTVRLAKSSPEMWAPILTENADNILMVLDRYINNLKNIRELIKEDKEEELYKSMKEINVIRKVLDGERSEDRRRKSDVLTMEEPEN
jgi:prephenate dehydrogenase